MFEIIQPSFIRESEIWYCEWQWKYRLSPISGATQLKIGKTKEGKQNKYEEGPWHIEMVEFVRSSEGKQNFENCCNSLSSIIWSYLLSVSIELSGEEVR